MTEKTLAEMLEELVAGMKTLVANQEKFQAEQQCQGLALGEVGLALIDHAKSLRDQGAAVVRLWHAAGLPIAEAPQMPEGPVN